VGLGGGDEPERRPRARTAAGSAAPAPRGDRPRHGRGPSSEGLHADLVPRVHTQEGLRDELPPGRTLLAAAEGARRGVLDADFLPLYRTYELTAEPPSGDVALLASPSAARALAATGAHIPVVAIGPQTEAEARMLGLDVAAVAETSDLDGLVAAVESLRE